MDTNSTIFVVMTIYNKKCSDSITFNAIKKIRELREVIVCDNSTEDMGNREAVERCGYTYIDMEGNKGLPKAYNAAIDFIGERQGIICIFDDDTSVDRDYFKKLRKYMDTTDWEIFLPLVYDEAGILSPCLVNPHFNTYYRARTPEEIGDRHISAINSGMAISTECFKGYRYDEKMFLEYVDHDFMRSMLSRYKRVGLMKDIVIKQKFAGNEINRPAETTRFKIFKKDLKYFYRKGFYARLCYINVIMRRRLKLCKKYRTLSFLFI